MNRSFVRACILAGSSAFLLLMPAATTAVLRADGAFDSLAQGGAGRECDPASAESDWSGKKDDDCAAGAGHAANG